eukprot:tig00001042_g6600.t1
MSGAHRRPTAAPQAGTRQAEAPARGAAHGPSARMSPLGVALWLPVNLLFGVAPLLWMATWALGFEGPRGTAIPGVRLVVGAIQEPITRAIGRVETGSLPLALAWNFGLFTLFGALHSGLASAGGKAALARLVPPQAMPTVFAAASGLAIVALGGAFMSCPGALWDASGSRALTLAILAAKCAALSLLRGPLAQFDGMEMIGTGALFRAPAGERSRHGRELRLVTDGLFGVVRHPMYSVFLLQFLLSPVFTYDHLALFLGAFSYIAWGHRLEDRKLEAEFGPAYAAYRRRVAAFVPYLF